MKRINYFIKKYLESRPMFMSIIRSQEAMLFQKYYRFVRGKILDFGCGDGFFAFLVFGKKKIAVGLDLFNNKRVDEARTKNIYKKVSLYDGNNIPYPSHYFNTVISNCVLEHIPNIRHSLKEVNRILKPGGLFITSVMTDKWEKNLFGSKILGNRYLEYMRKTQEHHNLFSDKKWVSYFKSAGFLIIRSEGYLYPKSAYWLDIAHYLSILSLIQYKLFGNWTMFPLNFFNGIKTRLIKRVIIRKDEINKASAVFYVLKK